MRKVLLLGAVAMFISVHSHAIAAENKVPAGKENLVLDSMSKGKQASGKKVLKGPVPYAHQAHVDGGVGCNDCHHKQQAGETPNPCHDCHKELRATRPRRATPSTAARGTRGLRCSPALAATRAGSPGRRRPTRRSSASPATPATALLKK